MSGGNITQSDKDSVSLDLVHSWTNVYVSGQINKICSSDLFKKNGNGVILEQSNLAFFKSHCCASMGLCQLKRELGPGANCVLDTRDASRSGHPSACHLYPCNYFR